MQARTVACVLVVGLLGVAAVGSVMAASAAQDDRPVVLPRASESVPLAQNLRSTMVVTVTWEGRLIVGGRERTLDEVREDLVQWRLGNRNEDEEGGFCSKTVLLRADRGAEMRHLQHVMALCGTQPLMIYKIDLACLPDEPGLHTSEKPAVAAGTTRIPFPLEREVSGEIDRDRRLEKIDLHVSRRDAVDRSDAAWVWDESQLDIRIQGRKVAGSREFYDLLKRIQEQNPEVRLVLYPHSGTLYIDAIKVLNECRRAGLTHIAMAGAPR